MEKMRRMRLLSALALPLAVLFVGAGCGVSNLWSTGGKFVAPGGEYANNTGRTIYLMLPLEPGERFENEESTDSGAAFKVLRTQRDLLEFHRELELQFSLGEASSKVKDLAREVKSVDDSLKVLTEKSGRESGG